MLSRHEASWWSRVVAENCLMLSVIIPYNYLCLKLLKCSPSCIWVDGSFFWAFLLLELLLPIISYELPFGLHSYFSNFSLAFFGRIGNAWLWQISSPSACSVTCYWTIAFLFCSIPFWIYISKEIQKLEKQIVIINVLFVMINHDNR